MERLFWGCVIGWVAFNFVLLIYSLATQKFKFKTALGWALGTLFVDFVLWVSLAASLATTEQSQALRKGAEEAALEYSSHVVIGEPSDGKVLVDYPDGDNPQMIYYDGALYIREVPE